MLKISVEEAYRVLEINKGASPSDIRSAYKRLALKTHPDKNPHDPASNIHFLKVAEAYRKLSGEDSENEDDDEDDEDEEYDDEEDDDYDDDELDDDEYFDRRDAFRLFQRMFGGDSKNGNGFSVDGVYFSFGGRTKRSKNDEVCDCPRCQMMRDPEGYREAYLDSLYEKRQWRIEREEKRAKPPAFKYAQKESDINLDWLDELEKKEKEKLEKAPGKPKKKKKVVLSKEGN